MQHNGKAQHGAATTTQGFATISQGFAGTPQPDAAAPQGFAGTPQPDAAVPQGFAGTPQPDATSSQGFAGTPQPDTPALQAGAGPARRRLGTYQANTGVERRLVAAQVALDAVLADPALQERLEARGYGPASILQGKALRDQALALVQQRHMRFGEQLAATDARNAIQAQAHAAYMRHVTLARIALRGDRGAAEKLDLSARKRTRAAWLMQAQQFYTNALGDAAIIARLAPFGVTREQLASAQRQVAAVEAGAVAQQGCKEAAQETTRACDAALEALNRWMRDFLTIARLARAD